MVLETLTKEVRRLKDDNATLRVKIADERAAKQAIKIHVDQQDMMDLTHSLIYLALTTQDPALVASAVCLLLGRRAADLELVLQRAARRESPGIFQFNGNLHLPFFHLKVGCCAKSHPTKPVPMPSLCDPTTMRVLLDLFLKLHPKRKKGPSSKTILLNELDKHRRLHEALANADPSLTQAFRDAVPTGVPRAGRAYGPMTSAPT